MPTDRDSNPEIHIGPFQAREGEERTPASPITITPVGPQDPSPAPRPSPRDGQGIVITPAEPQTPSPAPQTRDSSGSIIIHRLDGSDYEGVQTGSNSTSLRQMLEDERARNQELARQLSGKDEQIDSLTAQCADKAAQIDSLTAQLADKDAQIDSLTAQCADKDAQIESLNQRLQSVEVPRDDVIDPHALEDTDSVIAQLRDRVRELEEQLESQSREPEPQTSQAELEQQLSDAQARQSAAEQALADFLNHTPVVALPSLTALGALSDEQAQTLSRYSDLRSQFQSLCQAESCSLVSSEAVAELSVRLEQQLAELQRLQQQLRDAGCSSETALQELRELRERAQADLHYASYYEKLPEEKLDGLELFRSRLHQLDEQLTQTLSKGIVRAYVERGTELETQLKEQQQALQDTLQELCSLLESEEEPNPTRFDGAYTAGEYRQQASELLEQYERLLSEMNQLAEAKLRFKNILMFGQEEEPT